jgi:hypothetical protein
LLKQFFFDWWSLSSTKLQCLSEMT